MKDKIVCIFGSGYPGLPLAFVIDHRSRITHHTLPIADRDTRESPVKEMVKELKEFGVDAYGYDPLLSKEEIEGFGVKALDNLDVKIDCVIVAVAHDEF
ncbi:MAG: hypothetical protein GQ523_00960 [Methanophagales archaeon]|nr:hypothetical protein [Methanophagales archaeon]